MTHGSSAVGDVDLRHHGDREVGDRLVDLAVNVRGPAPGWLLAPVVEAIGSLAAYPDARPATAAVAARHGRPADEVLLTAGAAEAFTLLARGLRPGADVRRAVVVHPQFTEPEVALTAAGHRVERLLLDPADGFRLDPAAVPDDADLVVIGNPTNPTSVLHDATTLRRLLHPGRVVVVDEAFMDAVPGEPESLAGQADDGLVVVRSLTKTWGLAGLRVGYLLAGASLVRRLAGVQPPWSVSTPALAAATACSTPDAVRWAEQLARQTEADRARLVERLTGAGLRVVGEPRAPFVLCHHTRALHLREALRCRGFAVRRGDTFPGLGPQWLRVAVRGRETTDAFAAALVEVLGDVLGDALRDVHGPGA
jgi:histidinol-phosphate aminotransferase